VSQLDITETEKEPKECCSKCLQFQTLGENHCYIPLKCNKMRVFQVAAPSKFFDAYAFRPVFRTDFQTVTSASVATLPIHTVESGRSVL
jgi:hypothetical protein